MGRRRKQKEEKIEVPSLDALPTPEEFLKTISSTEKEKESIAIIDELLKLMIRSLIVQCECKTCQRLRKLATKLFRKYI